MFRKLPDKTIIEGIHRQDDKILNWLYDNYRESVRHHVLKNSGSETDVADVFQESIIMLYNQISSNELKLTSDLKGYFYGIAKNIWNSQLRKKSRNTILEDDFPDYDNVEEDDNLILERVVSRAFLKLKSDSQMMLTMFSEGFTYEEIAKKMNFKSEIYARRKKYLSKEELLKLMKEDPEYKFHLDK